MRILAPITLDIDKFPEGIITYSSCSLMKHHVLRKQEVNNSFSKNYDKVAKIYSRYLSVNLPQIRGIKRF